MINANFKDAIHAMGSVITVIDVLIRISLKFKTPQTVILGTVSVRRGLIIITSSPVILVSLVIVDVEDVGDLIIINANYVWGPISFLIIAVLILAPLIIFKINRIICVKVRGIVLVDFFRVL